MASVFVTAQSFQLVHNAALLLNSYDALRRYRQGDLFTKRNKSTEPLSYSKNVEDIKIICLQNWPRLTWPETKYLHTDFPESGNISTKSTLHKGQRKKKKNGKVPNSTVFVAQLLYF